MKIRSDFVSNSSSSSFMMVGTWIDKDDAFKILKEKNLISDKVDDAWSIAEALEDFVDLSCKPEIAEYAEDICIGLEYSDMKYGETRKEFGDRILKKIQKVIPDLKKVDVCESSGYY